jgi:hypothetical protein
VALVTPGLDAFRVARFNVTLEAKDRLVLPENKGSVLRGGFGHVFRKVGCIARHGECPPCLLKGACPYAYIFETPPPADALILRKYPHAPHPFVIEPPLEAMTNYEPGTSLTFGLVLVGRGIDYLPYFIYAFEELGRIGLGRDRGKFQLAEARGEASVESADGWQPIYSGDRKVLSSDFQVRTGRDLVAAPATEPADALPAEITLQFRSPTRLQYNGHPAAPNAFHIVFRNLLRRISLLNYFHCGGAPLDDARDLVQAARAIETVEARLRWHQWERYSGRQRQQVPMGGFTGRVTYRGDLAPFWPWLRLGEWVHVGKAATFGLGQYRIEGADYLRCGDSGKG